MSTSKSTDSELPLESVESIIDAIPWENLAGGCYSSSYSFLCALIFRNLLVRTRDVPSSQDGVPFMLAELTQKGLTKFIPNWLKKLKEYFVDEESKEDESLKNALDSDFEVFSALDRPQNESITSAVYDELFSFVCLIPSEQLESVEGQYEQSENSTTQTLPNKSSIKQVWSRTKTLLFGVAVGTNLNVKKTTTQISAPPGHQYTLDADGKESIQKVSEQAIADSNSESIYFAKENESLVAGKIYKKTDQKGTLTVVNYQLAVHFPLSEILKRTQ